MATLSIRGNATFWRDFIEKAKDALAGEYALIRVDASEDGAQASEDTVEINFLPVEDGPEGVEEGQSAFAILWLPSPATTANSAQPWMDWSEQDPRGD